MKHILNVEMPGESSLLFQRTLAFIFIDELDKIHDFQVSAVKNKSKFENLFAKFQSDVFVEGRAATKAVDIFKQCRTDAAPRSNLDVIMKGMRLLEGFDDDVVMGVLAKCASGDVYAFLLFVRTFLENRKMKEILIGGDGVGLLNRFVAWDGVKEKDGGFIDVKCNFWRIRPWAEILFWNRNMKCEGRP
jgi:hypothetical protein